MDMRGHATRAVDCQPGYALIPRNELHDYSGASDECLPILAATALGDVSVDDSGKYAFRASIYSPDAANELMRSWGWHTRCDANSVLLVIFNEQDLTDVLRSIKCRIDACDVIKRAAKFFARAEKQLRAAERKARCESVTPSNTSVTPLYRDLGTTRKLYARIAVEVVKGIRGTIYRTPDEHVCVARSNDHAQWLIQSCNLSLDEPRGSFGAFRFQAAQLPALLNAISVKSSRSAGECL